MTADPLWLNAEHRVSVRRCNKSHLAGGEYSRNWQIRQRGFPNYTRVFMYMSWKLAMWNAWRLVDGKQIGTNGLRGFHIEYEHSHFDYH